MPQPPTLESLFAAASELPHDQRDAFLTTACADAPALRARVDALLAALDHAGNFLASPTGGSPIAPAPRTFPPEPPGTRIGPYTILELIAEGGFGTVFLAEQSDPVRRNVALKLLKPGMDSRTVAARFEAERQALALMDHPHIARVFDGGLTPPALGLRPYFVMEHVQGQPITAFAAAHALTLTARLHLFIQVCEAVQHAHTKGIIHRDLKPSNVLVSMTDNRPFAKVIDFGIAKATTTHAPDTTRFTEARQLIGTPEYMSPEQAEGSPNIDTRTDVHGLGILLYELLTGTTPFDPKRLRNASFAELQRIIQTEDPLKPSTRAFSGPLPRGGRAREGLAPSAFPPSTTPPVPAQALRGDLDLIVLKALEKDPARRYASPSHLAADLRRYLNSEPTEAAPPTTTYRIRKFTRRHKGPVIAAAAIAATLLLGAAGTAYGLIAALRENQRLTESNQLGRDYLSKIMAELALSPNPASTPTPPDTLTPVSLEPAAKYTDAWSTVGEAALEHIRAGRDLRTAAIQKNIELAAANQSLSQTNQAILASIDSIATGVATRIHKPVEGAEIDRVYVERSTGTWDGPQVGFMVKSDETGTPRLLYFRGPSYRPTFVPPTDLTQPELTLITQSIGAYFGGTVPPYEEELRRGYNDLELADARRTIQFVEYILDTNRPTPTSNDLSNAVQTVYKHLGSHAMETGRANALSQAVRDRCPTITRHDHIR